MSYILDALRKSDQQRQQGRAPTLTTASVHVPPPQVTDRTDGNSWLPYALIALALTGAGFAIGLLRPWAATTEPASTAVVANSTAGTHPVTVPPATATPTRPVSKGVTPIPPSAGTSIPATPATSIASTVSTVAKTETTTVTSTTSTTTLPKPKPAPPPRPAPPAEPPAITITVHAYASEPSERLAGVNGRLLREGQEISPGLRLERITENGIIVNFRGRSFRRNLR